MNPGSTLRNAVRLHSLPADVLLAVAVVAAGIFAASNYHGRAPSLVFALAVIGSAPLAVRRLYPVPVLAVVVAVATGVGIAYNRGWWPFAVIVAMYNVAAHCPRRPAIIAGGLAILAVAPGIAYRVNWSPVRWSDLALIAGRYAPLLAAWLLGDNLRTRRAYLRAVEERAEQLEREQAANSRRAAAEEQARIAREVHDVVAHNLSVIVVQATAAERVFDSDPEDAQAALATIGSTARRALDELRHVLGQLGEGEQSLAPQPTLRSLDSLLEQVRAAGLAVDLEVRGERRALPPGIELSAYRIVQEALTNTLRHASAGHATVSLEYEPAALSIEVVDDGSGPQSATSSSRGRGLIGMRERASTYGGEVEAGPNGGGGFRVAARLPLGSD